ncbi:MAG: hypothetical protein ACOCX3_02745 [Chloroflexota bacterium]
MQRPVPIFRRGQYMDGADDFPRIPDEGRLFDIPWPGIAAGDDRRSRPIQMDEDSRIQCRAINQGLPVQLNPERVSLPQPVTDEMEHGSKKTETIR